MNPARTNRVMCKHAGYHDYLFLLVKTDAEWTRRRPRGGNSNARVFLRNQGAFAQACYRYAQGVEDYFGDFCKANRGFPGWKSPKASRPEDWLYQPMFFIPFGHADTMALCLLDDFDPLTYLCGEVRTTTEDLCLAFCPELRSLGLRSNGPLCEPKDLFSGSHRPRPVQRSYSNQFSPSPFPRQKELPLVAFTHYKMDGLANMGQALLFQNSLFRAMGQRIRQVNKWFLDRFDRDPTIRALLEDRDSVDSARCCLLDLQSAEEVATICLCRNFTVALSYVHAMRSLTYRDVFDADPSQELRKTFRESRLHQRLIREGLTDSGRSRVSGMAALDDEHALRWSHTSLGVSAQAVFNKKVRRPCTGYAEAYVQLQIPPAHQDEFEARFRHWPQKDGRTYQGPPDYRRVQAGPGDLLVPYLPGAAAGLPTLPRISTIIELMEMNLLAFGMEKPHDQGRNLIDMVTQLVIPIPRLFSGVREHRDLDHDLLTGSVRRGHSSPLARVLVRIQEGLCVGRHRTSGKHDFGRLSTDELKRQMKLRGVPLALRRVIESLFLDFATLIADPFLFDNVLDLYDAFATFHSVLTEHLPREDQDKRQQQVRTLSLAQLESLSRFATALHNALEHRLAKAYMHGEVRDMSVDFRGGLNQLVLAADAPMKCGLGLVRRFVIKKPDRYDIVGGVAQISFIPGARFSNLMLGVDDLSHLAVFEVDVPHILHVPSYIGYLHEAFHLVLDTQIELRRKKDPVASELHKLWQADSPSVTRERLDEIFALLMCHIFVFGNSRQGFMQANMVTFGQSEMAAGVHKRDIVLQAGEFLLRLFIAYDALTDNEIGRLAESEQPCSGCYGTPDQVRARFDRFYEVAAPLLWPAQSADGARPGVQRTYCLQLLNAAYSDLARLMPWLWARATEVYRDFVKGTSWSYGPYESMIVGEIRSSLKEGIPLTTRIHSTARLSSKQKLNKRGRATVSHELDPLVLICRMLQYYHGQIVEASGRLVHLRRRGEKLRIHYSTPPPDRPWHVFQIDKAVSTMFCPVPEARRQRVRKQVAMIKSFWNISAVLRGRRLEAMIRNSLEATSKKKG